MLLEKSVQAQFLIPMAATLGFGVIFSTIISLVLVPSLYLVLEDVKGILANVLGLTLPGVNEDDAGSGQR